MIRNVTPMSQVKNEMKLDAFSKHEDGFPILNFRAEFRWKTAGSISFMLCYRREPNVIRGIGWLDVHETSEEWRRIKMRICLHHNYVKFADHQAVVFQICTALEIPIDSYEANFISPLKQMSHDTGCDHEFISYGAPYESDDNPWDDRDSVSPLDVISRETAFGMILAAFPAFRLKIDGVKRLGISKMLGDQFLDCRETLSLADAVECALKENDQSQLRRLFDVLEKLVVFGDEYTRNASLNGLFERLQREETGFALEPYMLPKTLAAWKRTAEERKRWGINSIAEAGDRTLPD